MPVMPHEDASAVIAIGARVRGIRWEPAPERKSLEAQGALPKAKLVCAHAGGGAWVILGVAARGTREVHHATRIQSLEL
jgi:hypothetical protein